MGNLGWLCFAVHDHLIVDLKFIGGSDEQVLEQERKTALLLQSCGVCEFGDHIRVPYRDHIPRRRTQLRNRRKISLLFGPSKWTGVQKCPLFLGARGNVFAVGCFLVLTGAFSSLHRKSDDI